MVSQPITLTVGSQQLCGFNGIKPLQDYGVGVCILWGLTAVDSYHC
ncbi:hypothetical protein [Crocosphaera sp. XPORK-15E]|nr:hypothetical protein [Crocosphaera sp. XPORK-15E]MEA5535734.1 hypothetical protein [Crocosphaera sp. XPORK-15E]